ncbi:MAG: deoxyribose-phosphate aldolase [Oligoflexia bacterium]|nr:deoxyribose-phosphate aldolase [Oligoflexia bacterium]
MNDTLTFDPKLAAIIDHTLLKADATIEELNCICEEAKKFSFASVCVNSGNIPLVAKWLAGSKVQPISVVGFPLGAMAFKSKAYESQEAALAGAKEIDMVMNIGAMKSKDYRYVYEDIRAVVVACDVYRIPVKVILECAMLTQQEKIMGCTLAKAAGAAFVKTSTGFAKGGATIDDVKLMREIVGSDLGVKASGGIRTRRDALAMVAAGASRLGISASVTVVTGSIKNETNALGTIDAIGDDDKTGKNY